MSGVQTTEAVCPECGVKVGVSHRLRDRWLSAWRLVPLGLTICITAWILLGGPLTVTTTPVAMQGNVLTPLTPPRVVGESWAPMLTVGDLRAIASGSRPPTFKVSDLRFWQTEGGIADMCDAPLQVAVCNEYTEGTLQSEFRLGIPLPWFVIRDDGGVAKITRPFQRLPESKYSNWVLQRIPFLPGIKLVRADKRSTDVLVLLTMVLTPLALVVVAYLLSMGLLGRRRESARWRRRVRRLCVAIVLILYCFPSWNRDRVFVFGSAGTSGITNVTLSEVFSTPDTLENARLLASEIVRALEAIRAADSSMTPLDDNAVVAISYQNFNGGPIGLAGTTPPMTASVWEVDVRPFRIVSQWTMANARPASVGSFWSVGERLRVVHRLQRPDRVTVTFINLGSMLSLLSLVCAPVYVTSIARRFWLNRLARRRERAKQCVACGYQAA